jgi:hypothetical protein
MQNSNGVELLYSGELNACGQPHGYGESTVPSKDEIKGHIYTGMYVKGRSQGVGKDIIPNGQMYTGEFIRSIQNGVGLYVWPDGNRYEGQFKGGKMHGFGTFAFADGAVYIGWWAHNKKHGIGFSVAVDGSETAMTYDRDNLVSQTSGLIDASDEHADVYHIDPEAVLQREYNMKGMTLMCVSARPVDDDTIAVVIGALRTHINYFGILNCIEHNLQQSCALLSLVRIVSDVKSKSA